MAKSVNKVVLLGNVGKLPEIRKTQRGSVAEFSLATNERRPDGHGGWEDHTEWHTLVAFGRIAEVVREYVQCGAPLYIEGKLRTEKWDDASAGVRRYWTKVVILNVVLLSHGDARLRGDEHRQDSHEFDSAYAHIPESEITTSEIPF